MVIIGNGSHIDPPQDFDGIAAFSHSGARADRVSKQAKVLRESCQAEELLPNFAWHKKFAIKLLISPFWTIRTSPSVEPRHHRRR
jgi:hypothetical protein